MQARDEEGGSYSDRELRDQLMTLLFAGHDTTTSTVTFLFYELARHPAALARVLEENERVLGGASRRQPTSPARRCPSSRWRSTRRCGCTRRPGSGPGAASSRSSSAAIASPAACP